MGEHTIPHTAFYYIRHGETHWNKENRLQGQKDIPLNETGVQQATDVAEQIISYPITTIVASPLQRARMTAEIISAAMGKPVVVIDELKEVTWGDFEGSLKDENSEIWQHAWRQGKIFGNIEPYHDFVARVAVGVQRALLYEGPVLIVAHAVVHVAVQQILSMNYLYLENCATALHTPPYEQNGTWNMKILH